MQRLDRHLCLVCELSDEGTVIDGVLLVHGGLDCHTLLVDDDNAQHSHMSVYSVEGFLHFLRRSHAYSQL